MYHSILGPKNNEEEEDSVLLSAKHLHTLFHSSPQGSDVIGTVTTPPLQMKKLKLREVGNLLQDTQPNARIART